MFGDISKAAERHYKLLFVPYSVLFIAQLVFSVAGYLLKHFLGQPDDVFFLRILPAILAAFLVIQILTWAIRFRRNSAARKNSLNPNIRLLEEHAALQFNNDNTVEYRAVFVVQPLKRPEREMKVSLGWPGPLDKVQVASCGGCAVIPTKQAKTVGLILEIDFGRDIREKARYSFDFTLKFDNTPALMDRYLRKTQPYIAEEKIVQSIVLLDNPQLRFIEEVFRSANAPRSDDENYVISAEPRHEYVIPRPIQGKSYKLSVQ